MPNHTNFSHLYKHVCKHFGFLIIAEEREARRIHTERPTGLHVGIIPHSSTTSNMMPQLSISSHSCSLKKGFPLQIPTRRWECSPSTVARRSIVSFMKKQQPPAHFPETKTARSTPKAFSPADFFKSAECCQDIVDFTVPFFFPEMFLTLESQKRPNDTTTWSYQIASIIQKKFVQWNTHPQETWPKEGKSHKWLAVTRPIGEYGMVWSARNTNKSSKGVFLF